jgi:small subunit ribosomal protein S20
MRTSRERNQRNRAGRSALKTAVRKVLESKKNKDGGEALRGAVSLLDKGVKAGLIHKNCAANRKARLTKKVNALAK